MVKKIIERMKKSIEKMYAISYDRFKDSDVIKKHNDVIILNTYKGMDTNEIFFRQCKN